MQLVDSHCHLDHLDLSLYAGSLPLAMQAARSMGVYHFLCVCITLDDFPAMLELVKTFEDVSATVGLHPNETENTYEPSVDQLVQLSTDPKVVAIGETGLDYFRSTGDTEWQRQRFRHHIQAARQARKPLIVHTRDAKLDTLRLLQEENAQEAGGVMHCFTEDWETAKACLDLGFYISISGIVTFKSALQVQEVASKVPLDRLLIETDSPYLAPIPHRGKTNFPAYVRYVAEAIATLRGISADSLAEATTHNFFTLFTQAKPA